MGYQLEGRLLEVCTCKVLCPCWIGEDPDYGTCEAIAAWRIDKGSIDGVDVSGLTVADFADIPGNVLKGNWRVALLVDDAATPEQFEAIVDVWTGKRGGPVADFAKFFTEITAIERAPMTFTIVEGKGALRIGTIAEAEMAPYLGATGQVTTLNESIFTTIPGSPAYVARASSYRRDGSQCGMKESS